MDALLRLNSLSESLVESLRQADESHRRQVELTACLMAVSSVGIRGDEIDAAIGMLSCGGERSATVRSKLQALSEQADEEYFQLRAEARRMTPDVALLFRKARAFSALAFSLSPDSKHLYEVVYEAICASENRTEAIRIVENALSA
jgi:hypothetical protein